MPTSAILMQNDFRWLFYIVHSRIPRGYSARYINERNHPWVSEDVCFSVNFQNKEYIVTVQFNSFKLFKIRSIKIYINVK